MINLIELFCCRIGRLDNIGFHIIIACCPLSDASVFKTHNNKKRNMHARSHSRITYTNPILETWLHHSTGSFISSIGIGVELRVFIV